MEQRIQEDQTVVQAADTRIRKAQVCTSYHSTAMHTIDFAILLCLMLGNLTFQCQGLQKGCVGPNSKLVSSFHWL